MTLVHRVTSLEGQVLEAGHEKQIAVTVLLLRSNAKALCTCRYARFPKKERETEELNRQTNSSEDDDWSQQAGPSYALAVDAVLRCSSHPIVALP